MNSPAHRERTGARTPARGIAPHRTSRRLAHRPHFPDTVVVLRPMGRGNWEPVELRLTGRRAPPPLFFVIGQRVELACQVFRISEIRPE